jgi:hypothetical protein
VVHSLDQNGEVTDVPGKAVTHVLTIVNHNQLGRLVQRMWDPEAGGAFSRIQQRARKETGTQYWWQPGQSEPMRPPNIGAAAGQLGQ